MPPRALRGGIVHPFMEAQIKERIASRDYDRAFDLLLEAFRDKIFRLAFSLLRNESQAEDVAQEVLVKIWKALPTYHGGASISTWIYTITRNTSLTELKRRTARAAVSFQDPDWASMAESIPSQTPSGDQTALGMDVQTLLKALPLRSRAVISLFYLEQRSYEEVSTQLGIPLGTVKTLLFRAKRDLMRRARNAPCAPYSPESASADHEPLPLSSRHE